MPPLEFVPMISADKRLKTYALDCTATGNWHHRLGQWKQIWNKFGIQHVWEKWKIHTNFQLENLKENGPLQRWTHRQDKRKCDARLLERFNTCMIRVQLELFWTRQWICAFHKIRLFINQSHQLPKNSSMKLVNRQEPHDGSISKTTSWDTMTLF